MARRWGVGHAQKVLDVGCGVGHWGRVLSRVLPESTTIVGAARGASHVGIELFLDGVLAADTRARDAYARSLADAETSDVPFFWRDEQSRVRWQSMIVRLRRGAIPDQYRDPDFVADRLIGALSRRPRLALIDNEPAILRAFLPTLQVRVKGEAGALFVGGSGEKSQPPASELR